MRYVSPEQLVVEAAEAAGNPYSSAAFPQLPAPHQQLPSLTASDQQRHQKQRHAQQRGAGDAAAALALGGWCPVSVEVALGEEGGPVVLGMPADVGLGAIR